MTEQSSHGPGPSAWVQVVDDQGRPYYHNKQTNQTTWTKPEEMMTPVERFVAKTDPTWKELTSDGKKYWLNTKTNTTTWDMPEVFKQAYATISDGNATPAPPESTYNPPQHNTNGHHGYGQEPRRGGHGYGGRGGRTYGHGQERGYQNYDQSRDRDRDRDRDTYPESRQITYPDGPQAQAFVPASTDPEYATPEEAEAAYFKLLKRSGVQPDWTWEQTVRATVKDVQFRAIKDPKERKDAFEKYCIDLVVQNKEREKDRMAKLRSDFETMLKRHREIKHYTRWKTALPILEGEMIFRSTDNEAERRQLFQEYIVGLKRAHAEQTSTTKKNAMDGLIDLLPSLNLEPYTRWGDAQNDVKSTDQFKTEEKYTSLSNFDILTAFQNHVRFLERAFNEEKQRQKNLKLRKERKSRDGFKSLTTELRKDGKIDAGSKWTAILPSIENDERFLAVAGQSGSTPQELFWDVVEEEERSLRGPKNAVLDVLEDKKLNVANLRDVQEFLSIVQDDRRTANISRDVLALVFNRLREKGAAKHEDDKQQPDRHHKHAIEDLRALMKRVEPPIMLSDSYEMIRRRLGKSREWLAVPTEDGRQTAYNKHMRRLREKEDDLDRRDKGRDRGSIDRDTHRRDRDRDAPRGERSHRGGRTARKSRTPEQDAYQAERAKAGAERERHYRKSAMAEGLLADGRGRLTPPHRERDRDRDRERDRDSHRARDADRDRDLDRRPRSRREDDAHYDQERRDREEDRERQYRRRGSRVSVDELPYGDEHPAAPRRRRQDDEDDYTRRDSREPKRPRRERSRDEPSQPRDREPKEKKKSPPAPAKEVHSGSEEGEIEEED